MSERLREIRLVTPVVAGWSILFAVSICVASLDYDVLTDTKIEKYKLENLSASLLLATSGVGIWLAVLWASLYRKKSFLRLLMVSILIAGFTFMGTWAYTYLLDTSFRSRVFGNILGAVFISLLCWFPIALVRNFLAWRIVDDTDSIEPTKGRFSLKNMLLLTSIVAVTCGLFVWSEMSMSSIHVLFIAIPAALGMLLLSTMSRFRIRYVWLVAVCLASFMAVVATALSLSELGLDAPRSRRLLKSVFFPTFVGFSYAALLQLLAASYLHWHGILFRFGGTSGYAARRETVRKFPRHLFALASASVMVIAATVGGWFYYQHWVEMKWPIPAEPTTGDLPRLFSVAGHYNTSPIWKSRHSSNENMQTTNKRRRAARAAILDLGSDAVPFLLEQLTARPRDKTDSQVTSRLTSAELLSMLASKNLLEPHAGEVVDVIIAMLNTNDLYATYAYATLMPLRAIGLPNAERALPALKKACFTVDDPYAASHLFSTLFRLAGPNAAPVLLQVLRNKAEINAAVRARAALTLGLMKAEAITTVPLALDLLEETKSGKRFVISAIARFGPAANEAAPQLLEILHASAPEDEMQRTSGEPLWKITLHALGSIRAVQAVPELTAMLSDESLDANAKQLVVVALGEIGPAAQTAISALQAISAAGRDPHSSNLTKLQAVAEVAISRISLPQAASLIHSILRTMRTELDSLRERDTYEILSAGGYDYFNETISSLNVSVFALIWLGSNEDSKIMLHTATPSWNEDLYEAITRLESASIAPHILVLILSTLDETEGGAAQVGSLDSRWSTDGKILALINSLMLGLEADDSSVRATAADLLIAVGPLAESVPADLDRHLKDDDPQVRLRVAAALMQMGAESERVKETLIRSASVAGADVPPHIHPFLDDLSTSLQQ